MIRLISDSSTLYSIEEGKALPCDITPLCVTINGKTTVNLKKSTPRHFWV